MNGIIIKGVGGFYEVESDGKIYTCRAKGIFRREKIKPLVGDRVSIECPENAENDSSITDIFPRKNELIRPAVSNVDLAMERLGGLDLDSAHKVAGNGFYYLMGDIARLHSAVLSYGRDFMILFKWVISEPVFSISSPTASAVLFNFAYRS